MKKIFLCLLLLLTHQFMLAWGPMGHRIVAEVAYHYLSPEACSEVDEILGTHGMVYQSTWPDEIKSDHTIYPESYSWHFQDLPSNLSEAQLVALRGQYPTHGGLLWSTIDQLVSELSMHPDHCTIQGVDMPYRDALIFLIHLSADALCPVHLAHEDDRGGNTISMSWFGAPTNLHQVWDDKLIESRGYSYTEYAQMLVDQYGGELDSIADWNEMDYLNLVYQTTQSVYLYQQKADDNTYHYIWNWKTTCDRLLFLSGLRLADYIAQIR